MDYTFEVFKSSGSDGDVFYWWRLKSRNRKVLATSDTYTAKSNAMKAVNKLYKFLELGGAKVVITYVEKT